MLEWSARRIKRRMSLDRRAFLGFAAASPAAALNALTAGNATETTEPHLIIAALAGLDKRLQIDEGIVRDYLEYLSGSGIRSVLVNGSTGEFASFSALERKRTLEAYLKHKGSLRILAHTGASNINDTLDLVSHAQAEGVDALLVIPPFYYNQPATEGLARFYEPVLERAEVPVLLYNIPQVSGVTVTPELVQRFSTHPRLWGIKDSSGKAKWTESYIRAFPHLRIFTGASALIAGVLGQGGDGALTGNGNIFPRETQAIIDAHKHGSDTAEPQQTLNQRVALLKGYPIIPVMKHVLARMGVAKMHLRPPLTALGARARDVLDRRLKDVGVIS